MRNILILLLFLSVNIFAQKESEGNTFNLEGCCKSGSTFECSQLEECEIDFSQLINVPPDLINDADADPANELQSINISGNTITLSDGGGMVTIPASADTDDQQLSYNCENKTLTIDDGNTVDLSCTPTWTTITIPTIEGAGTYTTNLVQVLRTKTRWETQQDGDCREVYRFYVRVRGVHAAGNGWGWIDVPNIAGWTRDVSRLGTYRPTGNTNNPDNVIQGAMPDAPFMGNEAHHWSFGQRIYLNQFHLRDNDATIWVGFVLEFYRN